MHQTIFQTEHYFISQNVVHNQITPAILHEALINNTISSKNRYEVNYFGDCRFVTLENLDWNLVDNGMNVTWDEIQQNATILWRQTSKDYPVLSNGLYTPFTSNIWDHNLNVDTIERLTSHTIRVHFTLYETMQDIDIIDGLIDLILMDIAGVNTSDTIISQTKLYFDKTLTNQSNYSTLLQNNLGRIALYSMLTKDTKFEIIDTQKLIEKFGLSGLCNAFIIHFENNQRVLANIISSGYNRTDQMNILNYITNHSILSPRMKIMLEHPLDAVSKFKKIVEC